MFSQLGVFTRETRECEKKLIIIIIIIREVGTYETNVGSSIDPDAVSLSLSVFSSLTSTERKLSSPPADAYG